MILTCKHHITWERLVRTCSWSFYSSITAEMVYTTYVKQRILFYHEQGRKARRIRNLLLNEGIRASDVGIYKFLLRVAKTGCISRRPGSGRPTKITREVKALVENWMQKDDETTACQIHELCLDGFFVGALIARPFEKRTKLSA